MSRYLTKLAPIDFIHAQQRRTERVRRFHFWLRAIVAIAAISKLGQMAMERMG